MNNLYIKPSLKSPEVKFNITGDLLIKGVSIHEDTMQFYQPILDWVDKFGQSGNEALFFKLYFEYLSTSSTQMIVKLIDKINKLKKNGVKVVYEWGYEEGDDSIKELGEDIEEITECEFEFKELIEIK